MAIPTYPPAFARSKRRTSSDYDAASSAAALLAYAGGDDDFMAVTPESLTDYGGWVESVIDRYGVERAFEHWRVVCDLFETEDWWPQVVRRVKPIFENAFKIRNYRMAENQHEQGQNINLTFNQQHDNSMRETQNHYGAGSNNQVFNDKVTGLFEKR